VVVESPLYSNVEVYPLSYLHDLEAAEFHYLFVHRYICGKIFTKIGVLVVLHEVVNRQTDIQTNARFFMKLFRTGAGSFRLSATVRFCSTSVQLSRHAEKFVNTLHVSHVYLSLFSVFFLCYQFLVNKRFI